LSAPCGTSISIDVTASQPPRDTGANVGISSSRLRFSAFLLASLLFLAGACSPRVAPLPLLPSDAVILAFGDSITFGTGAAPAESYPAVLAGLVNRKVVNAGVPGEITRAGLARLPRALEDHQPRLLILIHGGNDLLRGLDPKETAGNLRAMIGLARERGIPVVLVSVPAPDLSLSPPPFYREVASETGVAWEEKALVKILGKGSLKSDLIHPNAAGYRRLAEALATLLRAAGAVEER
jgi:acyl-CoA thioesterase I